MPTAAFATVAEVVTALVPARPCRDGKSETDPVAGGPPTAGHRKEAPYTTQDVWSGLITIRLSRRSPPGENS